jgi:hypothetical protein
MVLPAVRHKLWHGRAARTRPRTSAIPVPLPSPIDHMMQSFPPSRMLLPLAVAVFLAVPAPAAAAEEAPPVASAPDPEVLLAAHISGTEGRSGRLRLAISRPGERLDGASIAGVPREGVRYRWEPLEAGRGTAPLGETEINYGLVAPDTPGAWRLRLSGGEGSALVEGFTLVTVVDASEKRGGFLNGYHIGRYAARGSAPGDRYAPPEGFIEVTEAMRMVPVSDHLFLGDFLTKDQVEVWPKYLVLDLRLIDKLELVLAELRTMGVRASQLTIMSGFRTPQYNGPGGNGRATLSRHTYGDAADVWIDVSGNGMLDDLNGDGRVDEEDVQLILRAVERVEARYPELVGGAGVYGAAPHRGPFIHIDTRGHRSRW